jgi:alkylation response protein AidB-like acyl-CoA dehydrogenase
MPVLQYGSEEQKRRFLQPMKGEMLACFGLTEPQAGSDAAAIKTRARRHGNRWVLNGTKQFISSGKNAQIAIVFAVTDPRTRQEGAFLVTTDGPALRWPGRAQARPALLRHCAARFRRHRADPDQMLGAEGDGYKIALSNLEGGRIGIAAQSVGMAGAAHEAALACSKKSVRSRRKPRILHVLAMGVAKEQRKQPAFAVLRWRKTSRKVVIRTRIRSSRR